MKVFIDTNVFLDYILSRQVGFVEANELFMLSANYQIDLILSDLTLANVRYVTRRDFTNEIFYEVINDMRDLFEIAPIGPNAVDRAFIKTAHHYCNHINKKNLPNYLVFRDCFIYLCSWVIILMVVLEFR